MKTRILMACCVAGLALAAVSCSEDATTAPIAGSQYLKFNVGDEFHYTVYDLDTDNNRSDSSMQHWVVKDTGVAGFGGQSVGITRFEVTTDGQTEKDTVYVQTRADGIVQMYDVLGTMLNRFTVGEAIATSVPKKWVQISDVKSPSARTWESTGDAVFSVQTDVQGFPVNASVTLTMDASHKGKQSVQAGDSTYANAFRTDHVLKVAANDPTFGQLLEADSSAMDIHYDVDINAGIIRQKLDSRIVNLKANIGGNVTTIPQPVAGFEMVLTSYVRQ